MYRSIKSGIPLVYSSTETKSDIALSYIPPSNCNCASDHSRGPKTICISFLSACSINERPPVIYPTTSTKCLKLWVLWEMATGGLLVPWMETVNWSLRPLGPWKVNPADWYMAKKSCLLNSSITNSNSSITSIQKGLPVQNIYQSINLCQRNSKTFSSKFIYNYFYLFPFLMNLIV